MLGDDAAFTDLLLSKVNILVSAAFDQTETLTLE